MLTRSLRFAHLHHIEVVVPRCLVQRGIALAVLRVDTCTHFQQRADCFQLVLARREQKRCFSLLHSERVGGQQQYAVLCVGI